MGKFRKRPIVIEAVQFLPGAAPWPDGVFEHTYVSPCARCDDNTYDHECVSRVVYDGYRIRTLEGVMHVTPRDWIITGVKGERYPCKPDIFEVTYEEVADGS